MTTAQKPEPGTAVAEWSEIPEGVTVTRGAHAAPLPQPADIAAMVRQFDEDAFAASLMGEALEKWFYEFTVSGKTVQGVSVIGAEEFARVRAERGFPIRFPAHEMQVREETRNGVLGIFVCVVARCVRTGADGIGMAFYPYMVERKRDGRTELVPDNMPDRKALSVAKRNAILDLVPQHIIVGMLTAKKQIVATNQARHEDEVRAHVATLKQVPSVDAGKRLGAGNPDPYQDTRPRLASGAGERTMPFGKSKGTPLSQVETSDLESALAWARDKGKFADYQDAFANELERRREDAGEEG